MQIIVMGNLAISHSAINYKRDASLKFPSSQKSTKPTKTVELKLKRGTPTCGGEGGDMRLEIEIYMYERKIICGIW